jgi:hypothetical protein
MKVETYKCDVCGKQKADVNHWWLISSGGSSLLIAPWSMETVRSFEFHLCGAECVGKKVNEFLNKVVAA